MNLAIYFAVQESLKTKESQKWNCKNCMRENLCEIRNCGNKSPSSNFKLYLGNEKITECPVSYITPWSNRLISEYFLIKNLNSLGLTQSVNDYSAKECEAFLLIKDTFDKIEHKREEENLRKQSQKH